MSITNGGAGVFSGAVTVPNGFSSNGTTFDNTGATITTTDNDITINHTSTITLESDLSSGDGDIAITSNGAVPSINIDCDIFTADGNITINDQMDLTDLYGVAPNTISITSTGAGNITFNGNIDGTTNTDLIVSSSTGDIQFVTAAIGSAAGETLGDITISGSNISLYSVGTTTQVGSDNTLSITATNLITMTGSYYRTVGDQDYNTGGYTRWNQSADGDMEVTGGTPLISFNDLYLDYNSAVTVSLLTDINCDLFVFYGGILNLGGQTLTTSDDFAVFGTNYDPDDNDWGAVNDDNRFDYQDIFDSSIAYDPGSYDAAFSDNAGTSNIQTGSTITVGANFYVNGADLDAAGSWNLNVNSTASAQPLYNDSTDPMNWGAPYNVAFNLSVSNSLVSGGNISAAEPVVLSSEINNNVIDNAGNTEYVASTTDGWDFDRPEIFSAQTVWDDAIYITFTEPIENSNDEISDLIGNSILLTDGNTVDVTDTFMDINDDGTSTDSTDGQGDITSFYIRFSTTWNTDAELTLTGGGASSTDADGTNRSVVPDIAMIKSALYDAGGHNPVRNYDYNTFAAYESITDGCGPVIVDVEVGNHDATGDEYDYHNYMTITWSEPVKFMEDDGIAELVGTGSTITSNTLSDTFSFNTSGYLGEIPDVTGDVVEVLNILEYDGSVESGSTNPRGFVSGDNGTGGNISNNSLERTTAYELQINIVAYSSDGGVTWTGYLGEDGMDLTQPSTFTGLASVNVQDANDNPQKVTSGSVSGAGWDVDPPGIPDYTISSTADILEIVPLDFTSNSLLDRFEYHVLDDYYADSPTWDSETSHVDPTTKGIRDSSLIDITAFTFESEGITPLLSDYNDSFDTEVNNDFFDSTDFIDVEDDPYFRIVVDDTLHSWDTLTKIWTSYDEDTGYLTDLAGNRLRSYTKSRAIESIPPEISLTLAAPGNDWIYVRFTESVYGDQSATTSIDVSDFYYSGGSLSITSIEDFPGGVSGEEYIFYLSDVLGRNDIITGRIVVNSLSVYDAEGNAYQDQFIHRVSDLGIDIVTPVWASDGIHDESILEGTSLKTFDGTGRLMDSDILLQARIDASAVEDASMTLYFDANVDDSKVTDGLWLPFYHSDLSPEGNFDARSVNASEVLDNGLQNFVIPSTDSEMETGNTIEFLFMLDGLPCVRLSNSSDLWSYEPWSFDIDDIREQKGGVTILNNVVNPNNGDKAVLIYEVTNPGVVTAQIFSLNGNLVKILQRGRQSAGTYQYVWDGRNNGGRIVARGVYFVRVVGPDMDEIRKVMIVK
jgi:hypothetical protein